MQPNDFKVKEIIPRIFKIEKLNEKKKSIALIAARKGSKV